MTYQLIETKTRGTAAASIEFTSSPQDGTDLVALTSLRADLSTFVGSLRIEFNNNTSSIYSVRQLQAVYPAGPNSVTNPNGVTTASIVGYTPGASQTADTFSNASITIPNYTGSTNKSFSVDSVSETNATFSNTEIVGLHISAGLFSSTAAITSIKFSLLSGNLVAGSIISLYKITKGSDGIVTTSP